MKNDRVSSTVTNDIARRDFWGSIIIWACSIAVWIVIAFIGYLSLVYADKF